jgi:hypothetical protein
MDTNSTREYHRNRFANLTEEQRELHNRRNLQHYHGMSEFARQKHIAAKKTYYQNNKERIKSKTKEYYSENTEVIKQKKRDHYARVKQNFGEKTEQNLQQISFTNNL